MDERRFEYKVGNRYLVFGTWTVGKDASDLACQHSTVVCTRRYPEGTATLAYEPASHDATDRQRNWIYRPDGNAYHNGLVMDAPLSVIIKELPPRHRVIAIDGKEISISEESYQALRKGLL